MELCQALKDQHARRQPTIPIAARHLWVWFRQLDRARCGNGNGPNPIGHSEIDAWARLRRLTLDQ
ncbi:phage tail assembly chaperone [Phyllobacterium brassicacearum]|uniref:phage tail assembly chaperone n=1 Tax=Phyllobacterium brassicacearum TaxID=314235 RepID=UPI003CC939F8